MLKSTTTDPIRAGLALMLALLTGLFFSAAAGSFKAGTGDDFPVQYLLDAGSISSGECLNDDQPDGRYTEYGLQEENPELDEFNSRKKDPPELLSYRSGQMQPIHDASTVFSSEKRRITPPPEC